MNKLSLKSVFKEAYDDWKADFNPQVSTKVKPVNNSQLVLSGQEANAVYSLLTDIANKDSRFHGDSDLIAFAKGFVEDKQNFTYARVNLSGLDKQELKIMYKIISQGSQAYSGDDDEETFNALMSAKKKIESLKQ